MDALNRLRAPGGACAAQAAPFTHRQALDAAAQNIAGGQSLEAALKASGYRATRLQEINVVGAGKGAGLEKFLASRYCAQLAMPELSEAGVHVSGNRVWIVLAAPFAPKVGLTREQIAERTVELVNRARAQARTCGDKFFAAAKRVKWNNTLERASQLHAADMAANNYFSHTGLDGSTPAQRVTRAGYRYRAMGENIASGQRTPEDAVAAWIKSPPHCANLMNGVFTEMGVAYEVNAASSMGVYWTQMFGKPM